MAIAVIAAVLIYRHHQKTEWMRPKLNRTPQHFMRIYGHVAKGLRVKFSANYVTGRDDCQIYTAWPEGAASGRVISDERMLQPDARGDYSMTMPLDKYQKGYCDWELVGFTAEISSAFSKEKPSTCSIIAFNAKGNKRLRKAARITVPYVLYGKYGYGCGDTAFQLVDFPNFTTKQLQLNFILKKGKIYD